MNCCYHPDYPAVTQCSCGKGLCNYCSNLIDPNMCLDCSKAKIINSIIKAVVTLLFSIIVAVLAVVSYNLVIKGTITNEYVRLIFSLPMDFSSGFLDELLKFLSMHDITFSATLWADLPDSVRSGFTSWSNIANCTTPKSAPCSFA